ncbi:ESX secretion-associated protein EspG [Actinokineospora sp.]|uniref:ESX secretion-associated protein EspG n=1 Tax=Actinokineospora sp. TaxID=1872133 RepID=UPI003D6BE2A2
MVLPRSLTLPVDTLARILTWENLGEPHRTLAPTPVWRSASAESDAERDARAQAAQLGLLDRRGRVEAEVAASLSVVCRPRVEFYGWINDGKETIGVLAAAIGREAILAIGDGEQVWLSQAKADGLAQAAAAQTPDVPPARSDTVSVLRSEAADRRSQPSPQVRLVRRIAELPVTGSGELHVAVRDSMGRRRQSPRPLNYADTPHGRWLNHATPLSTGDDRVTVAPATRADLAAMLTRMHSALAHD